MIELRGEEKNTGEQKKAVSLSRYSRRESRVENEVESFLLEMLSLLMGRYTVVSTGGARSSAVYTVWLERRSVNSGPHLRCRKKLFALVVAGVSVKKQLKIKKTADGFRAPPQWGRIPTGSQKIPTIPTAGW